MAHKKAADFLEDASQAEEMQPAPDFGPPGIIPIDLDKLFSKSATSEGTSSGQPSAVSAQQRRLR